MHIIKTILEDIGLTIVAVGIIALIAIGIFGFLVDNTWGKKQ